MKAKKPYGRWVVGTGGAAFLALMIGQLSVDSSNEGQTESAQGSYAPSDGEWSSGNDSYEENEDWGEDGEYEDEYEDEGERWDDDESGSFAPPSQPGEGRSERSK